MVISFFYEIIVLSQSEQVLILPFTFSGRGNIGISRAGSVPDSGSSVNGSSECMGRNMGSCQRLTCGTGSRTGCMILGDLTSSGMGCKGSSAYICHPEHARAYPIPACFDSFAWAGIARVYFLKTG